MYVRKYGNQTSIKYKDKLQWDLGMEKDVKRYDAVSVLRIMCAYLIIVIHVMAFQSLGDGAMYVTSEFICRMAVPFFFITSGYFFYLKVNREGYFKKYIKKLSLLH